DRQVGEVLGSLSLHGMNENTLFIYTSDHGAQWPFAKWNLYDAGMHVPLILRWPGVVKPGLRNQTMVSTIDILPTIIEPAGGFLPGELDGKSLMGAAQREEICAAHTGD